MWIAGTLAAFACSVLAHVVAVRLWRRGTSVGKFVTIAFVIGGAWILFLLRQGEDVSRLAASALVFALLVELYIFTFTLVGNSVAVSLMLALADGADTLAQLERTYDSERMVRRRIDQLARAGLIARHSSGLALTDSGRRLIRRFDRLAALIRPGGGCVGFRETGAARH